LAGSAIATRSTLCSREVSVTVDVQRRLFTVGDYYAMLDAGILTEDDRVELIQGEIVQMAPIGSAHAACVDRLTQMLVRLAGEAAIVRVQNPIRVSDLSEPQPDFALLRPRDDFYAKAHPRPADTLLVIEVAHSTLAYDLEIKTPLYALAGIPEVWVVDVGGATVRVFSEPSGNRYRIEHVADSEDVLRPVMLPSVQLPVREILV
jgi:Uma2 family endonuclease